MANTLKFGNGTWAVKKDSLLAYNSENNNFKPLPFDFSRASSATVVNKDGLIETVGSGEPRIDFKDNTKGALLLEPQRSNLIPYSSDYTGASWVKTGLAVNSNQIISPDGTLNADEVNITAANAHYLFDSISVSASTNYTFTFYVKKGTATDASYSILNETNFTNIVNTTSYFNQISDTNWTRISVEFTTPSGATSIRVYPLRDGSSTGTIYIYGAQLEEGSYSTSLINTQGSAVTRVAESSSQTVPDGVIGQTEGSAYFEYTCNGSDSSGQRIFVLRGSSTADRIAVFDQSGKIRIYVADGGGLQLDTTTNVDTVSTHKVAFRYKLDDFKLYIDGTAIVTDTTFTVPSLNSVYVGTSEGFGGTLGGNVSDVKLYNTALTDNELQQLTQV